MCPFLQTRVLYAVPMLVYQGFSFYNNKLVLWMEKFVWILKRWRNLLGESQTNLIASAAEPDKLSPFSSTNPIILFILLPDFSNLFFSTDL